MIQFDTTNKVLFSRDFKNLSGGGKTVEVYNGAKGHLSLTRVNGTGILSQLDSATSHSVFFSPDYLNLTGGGRTQQVYASATDAVHLVALQNNKGVLTEVTTAGRRTRTTSS